MEKKMWAEWEEEDARVRAKPPKTCPLTYTCYKQWAYCKQELCEWWIKEAKCCAVLYRAME